MRDRYNRLDTVLGSGGRPLYTKRHALIVYMRRWYLPKLPKSDIVQAGCSCAKLAVPQLSTIPGLPVAQPRFQHRSDHGKATHCLRRLSLLPARVGQSKLRALASSNLQHTLCLPVFRQAYSRLTISLPHQLKSLNQKFTTTFWSTRILWSSPIRPEYLKKIQTLSSIQLQSVHTRTAQTSFLQPFGRFPASSLVKVPTARNVCQLSRSLKMLHSGSLPWSQVCWSPCVRVPASRQIQRAWMTMQRPALEPSGLKSWHWAI